MTGRNLLTGAGCGAAPRWGLGTAGATKGAQSISAAANSARLDSQVGQAAGPASAVAGASGSIAARDAHHGAATPSAATPDAAAALAWLASHGCPPQDLAAWSARADRVRAATLAGHAQALAVLGQRQPAIRAAQQALQLDASQLGLRLLLADWLVAAGETQALKVLAAGLPDAALEPPWPEVVASLMAFSARDWPTAEQHLLRLAGLRQPPIDARVWLGRVRLAQQDWSGAADWLTLAVHSPAPSATAWRLLATACMHLQRFDDAARALGAALAPVPPS